MVDARALHDERSAQAATAGEASVHAMGTALKALDEHYRWCDKQFSGAHNEHGIEARKRLNQSIWILRRVTDLQVESSQLFTDTFPWGMKDPEEHRKWAARSDSGEFDVATRRTNDISDEIELLSESFYYFAFRAQSVLSNHLPGLKGFDAPGVRRVRNHLIEHPERGDSGVIANGFAYGGAGGPVVKGVRRADQVDIHRDAGLFANATEFADRLTVKINAVLAG